MRASGPEETRAPVERAPAASSRAGPGPAGVRKAPVRQVDPAPNARGLLGLQTSAGNAAVGALVVASPAGPLESARASEPLLVAQRLAGAPGSVPPPPVPPRPPVPTEHPGFNATQNRLSAARRGLTAHAPAQTKADEAARAAKPPAE